MRHRVAHDDRLGLGDAYWRRQKRASERHMAGFDGLAPELRDVVRSAGNVNDAAVLRSRGVRTFAEAEAVIARIGLLQAEARAGVIHPSFVPLGHDRLRRKRRRL